MDKVVFYSRPAVAKRPRDASCLSVASAVHNTSSTSSASDLTLRTTQFCSVLFVVVVHAGCDKHDHLCVTVCAVNCTAAPSQLMLALQQSSIDSQIFVENRDFYLPHLDFTPHVRVFPSEYCHDVCCGKTRMLWLLDDEKSLKIYFFVSTESTTVMTA